MCYCFSLSAHLALILGPLYCKNTISLSAHLMIRGTLYYIYTTLLSAHSLSAHFFWNASCALNEALLYKHALQFHDFYGLSDLAIRDFEKQKSSIRDFSILTKSKANARHSEKFFGIRKTQ